MGQLELQRKRYADVQLAPATRELLVETLRLGVRSDRATVSNTLRRMVTKIKMQKDRRTLYATVPSAVLSDGVRQPLAWGTAERKPGGKHFMGVVPGKSWRRSHCPASKGLIT